MTSLLPPEGGLLLVDKPAGCTSHDVVGRVRRIFRTRKVGHAGTLDPMATGLLVVALERSTKLLSQLILTGKSYTAIIRLGSSTVTDDAQGEVLTRTDPAGVSDEAIAAGIQALTGDIRQRPSAVSAIKVDGRRAYDLVRSGEQVELPARPVRVDRFELLAPPRRTPGHLDLQVAVDCSSGTYIRALARDLGAALGVGGHLTELRRTVVGPFAVTDAVDVFDGQPAAGRGERNPDPTPELTERALAAVRTPARVAGEVFGMRAATPQEQRDISFGRAIPTAGIDGVYALVDADGSRLLALLTEADGTARPVLVFSPAG